MRKSNTEPHYFIRSSFQTSYAIIFVFAIWDLISTVSTANNPVRSEIDKVLQALHQANIDLDIIGWFAAVFPVFVVAFSCHLVRIYITLESMEDEEGPYGTFYDAYGPGARQLEFAIRVAIVGIISLKVIEVRTFEEFAWFVLWFYLSLLSWSALALCKGKAFKSESFMISSLSGLGFTLVLFSVQYLPKLWQVTLLFLWVTTMVLLIDILYSVYKYGKKVATEARWKASAPW